jgi:CBS domain-containing protein
VIEQRAHPAEPASSTEEVLVADIMSRRIVAIRSDAELSVALDTFLRTALRHLVVVDPDRTCRGLLSAEQLLAVLGTTGRRRRVADHVLPNQPCVHLRAPVRDAAELMVVELVDALPVVDDDGRVVGVVTWGDIVAMVAGHHLRTGRP